MFRLSTFFMNAVTLRYISREELGIVNVRLLLLYSTGLFLSREAFRKACLSNSSNSKSKANCVPIGIICCGLLALAWIKLLEVPDPLKIPYYTISTVIFAISVVIELFAEPLWVLGQAFLFIKLKVVIEGIAMIVKCVVSTILVIAFPQLGILSFSFAQILFSMIYTCLYFGYFAWYIKQKRSETDKSFPFLTFRQLLPNLKLKLSNVGHKKAVLVWSFFKQSLLKQFLTEGERYIMTLLNVLTFSEQGIYDVVNNLGSLAARFIFLPIEESYYVFFAKLLERGKVQHMHKDVIESVKNVLFCLLRLVSILGMIILTFGYPYSYLLLDFYGGKILSQGVGPSLLQTYCVYVLLIAINGTTECFVFAAMNKSQVDGYNKKMLLFSILFLIASYFLTNSLGSVGFILANCVNMTVRVIHSIYFIYKYLGSQEAKVPLSGIIPDKLVIASLTGSFIVCSISEAKFCCQFGLKYKMIHIIIGAVCLLISCGCILLREKVLISFLKSQFFKRKRV